MTTREAGERLGVTDRRVLQFVKDKRLRTERAGRIHLVRRADVERLARELAEEAASGKKRGPKPNVTRAKRESQEGAADA